jgi:hypothetical protein
VVHHEMRCELRASPRAKIFRREVFAGDRAKVPVDAGRANGTGAASFVEVLKEPLSRNLTAPADDASEAGRRQLHTERFPRLAAETKLEATSVHAGVPVEQRGQTVRAVRARILIVPDAQKRRVEKVDDGGDHFAPRQAGPSKVHLHMAPHRGKRAAEIDHLVEFRRLPELTPLRMVAILLPAACVSASGLDVACRLRADPDAGPCRGNGQSPNVRQKLRVSDDFPVAVQVLEITARAPAPNSRRGIADIHEPSRSGSGGRRN